MSEIKEKYEQLQRKISTAYQTARIKNLNPPTLIAVSKGQSVEKMIELYKLGHRDFGENYVQELLEKVKIIHANGIQDLKLHFIGHLQTNKIKLLIPHVTMIHSVHSIRLLEELDKRLLQAQMRKDIFIEVNIDQEPSKQGIQPNELEAFLEASQNCTRIRVRGLMILPQRGNHTESPFVRLQKLAEKRSLELSMGMSDDFEDAIHEGAHWVRVGTALFGHRS